MPIYDNYMEIAKAAAAMIRENDTVYLTVGTFGYIMFAFLPKEFSYTVVVNSVDIGKAMRGFDNIDV